MHGGQGSRASEFEREEVLAPDLQGNSVLHLGTAEAEVRAARGLVRPVIDNLAPINREAAKARAEQSKGIRTRLSRCKTTAHAHREVLSVNSGWKCIQPEELRTLPRFALPSHACYIA